jgi:hypothetical protein
LLRVEPILSNVPGSLPWHVWHERHPALFTKLKDAHPYPPSVRTALDELLDETLTGTIQPLPGWYDEYVGRRWLDVPFLWAESFFYRRLLAAVGYFSAASGPASPGPRSAGSAATRATREGGASGGPEARASGASAVKQSPWAGFDLFAAFKDADLADAPLADLPSLDPLGLLLASLWGNQADLGFQIGAAIGPAAHLVVDDTAEALSALTGAARVGLVADNAGKELLADLGLVDHLLGDSGTEVTLYLKPHPYYVSDATTADLVKCLRALTAAGGPAAAIASRLHAAAAQGRLRVATDPFFCAPLPFHQAPPDLFDPADVLIFKGDLNYRRLVGDNRWPASTPFASTLPPLDSTVIALRTLKSDVLVGVDDSVVESLSGEKDWRTNGRYGSVQVFTP